MKQFYMLVIVAIAYTSTANAQKGEFNQNFEIKIFQFEHIFKCCILQIN